LSAHLCMPLSFFLSLSVFRFSHLQNRRVSFSIDKHRVFQSLNKYYHHIRISYR
jgi:hypothetical protein